MCRLHWLCKKPSARPVLSAWVGRSAIVPLLFFFHLLSAPPPHVLGRFWALCGLRWGQLHMAGETGRWSRAGSVEKCRSDDMRPEPPSHLETDPPPPPEQQAARSWCSIRTPQLKLRDAWQSQGCPASLLAGFPQTPLLTVGHSYTNKALTEMLLRK